MIQKRQIKRIENSQRQTLEDFIAIEEPLEISLKKESEITTKKISVTMRTPGQDAFLALGFLFTEGILRNFNDVVSVNEFVENEVLVNLVDSSNVNSSQMDRNFYTTSSCGVCGKASIDAIKTISAYNIRNFELEISQNTLYSLQQTLLAEQSTFNQTGGIHAAALFNQYGKLLSFQEDVGRHNALDKLIGETWSKNQIPAKDKILLLSGRASFELVQKASMAGIPIVVSVGAPSSLAIELADEQGITLIGFLKSDRFNLYTHYDRVQ